VDFRAWNRVEGTAMGEQSGITVLALKHSSKPVLKASYFVIVQSGHSKQQCVDKILLLLGCRSKG
jgi:hypothetical protein